MGEFSSFRQFSIEFGDAGHVLKAAEMVACSGGLVGDCDLKMAHNGALF